MNWNTLVGTIKIKTIPSRNYNCNYFVWYSIAFNRFSRAAGNVDSELAAVKAMDGDSLNARREYYIRAFAQNTLFLVNL